jgi:hypothetical protein
VQAIAAQAYMEMLERVTRVGEFHYLHHDADGPRRTPTAPR